MRVRSSGLLLLFVFGTLSTVNAQAGQGTAPPKPPAKSAAAPAKGAPAPAKPAAIAATDVALAVSYTGKGVVDATHNILVFLFSDPNIGANSQPLGPPQIVQKNGATITFNNITTKPVYAFAIYNEKGTYDGRSGPPPAGTPVGQYGTGAAAAPITPGMKAPLKFTFTGAKKWGQ